jgi:hypothetical protein
MNAAIDTQAQTSPSIGGGFGIGVQAPPAIVATFQMQKLADPRRLACVDIGEPLQIDVTDVVLSKTAEQLQRVMDGHASSDALVPYGRHFHDGVYRVEIEQSIKAHFGVASLREISQAMVDESLEQFKEQLQVQRALQAKASLTDNPDQSKRFARNASGASAF